MNPQPDKFTSKFTTKTIISIKMGSKSKQHHLKTALDIYREFYTTNHTSQLMVKFLSAWWRVRKFLHRFAHLFIPLLKTNYWSTDSITSAYDTAISINLCAYVFIIAPRTCT